MAETAERSLDDIVRVGDVAMITTVDDGRFSARPLTIAGVHGGAVTFLADAEARWMEAIAADPQVEVGLTVETGRGHWVSMRGRTAISADAATIDELWMPASAVHFSSREDPSIRALQVSVVDGEFWGTPGGGAIGRVIAMFNKALAGEDPFIIEHGPVARDEEAP